MDLSGAGWGMPVPVQSMSASPTGTEMVRRGLLHSMVRSQILQIAVFSLLLGVALALLPEGKRLPWLKLLQALGGTMFRLTRVIMYLAPLAAGAALTYTVGSMGLGTLFALVKLVATYYATLAVFCLGFLIPILAVFRIPLAGFVAAVREPAAIGLATTSSEAALPLAMERMEEFGVPRWIVSFVVPLGYSFNMDGSSVYLSMAAVFAAQAAGIHLSFPRQLAMLATLMLASKGVAGVPRAVLMVLLVTASAIHIPTPPVLLLLGVDTLMDMGRTMMNVVGNCMACAVIARSEGIVVGHRATPTRDFNLPPG
jgi:proton glutamate symport protein